MAKVGDQFIITLDSKMTNHNGNLYTANGMSTCVFDDKGLEKLTPYRKGMDYKQGLIDGIDAMYTLLNMTKEETYKCFREYTVMDVLYHYTPEQIVEKTKNYYKASKDETIKKMIKDFNDTEELIQRIKAISKLL